jgi:hypothetical protein
MSVREVLIVLAHAQMCERCRDRLLNDANAVCRGRAVTDEERSSLARLMPADFANTEHLAAAAGQNAGELTQYGDHPVARLRHF